MFFKLKKTVILLVGTPPDLKDTGPIIPGGTVVEAEPPSEGQPSVTEDGKHQHVKYRNDVGNFFRGWIPVEHLGEAEAPERPKVILWGFLKSCVTAELWINDLPDTGENFINADYLVALALYESKLENIGNKTPGTDAVGPFQITSARWKAFLDKIKDPEFTADDRHNISDQIFGAAYLTREDMRAISEAITKHDKDAGTNTDPEKIGSYIPTYSDLFIAALAGVRAAIRLRQLQIEGKTDTVITAIIEGLDEDRKKEMERIFRHNHHLLKVDKAEAERKGIAAGPRSVKDLYEVVEAKLDALLADAFKLIKDNIPEDLPMAAGDGAGWLETARAELADPWNDGAIDETTAPGKGRVLEYFKATDSGITSVQPWCGAFVAYCLKQSGGDIAKSVVKGSARAANWKLWGDKSVPVQSKDIPAGAVVVLSPSPGTVRSGHVGFYSPDRSNVKGKITLLGGNQSDTVNNTEFRRSQVAAIRWYGAEPAAEAALIEGTSTTKLKALLDVIAEKESNKNYNAYFSKPNNRTKPKLTDMSVNEVLAWQKDFLARTGLESSAAGKYQIVSGTLRGLTRRLGIKGSEKFDPAMQDRMGIELLKRRGLAKYLSGRIKAEHFANQLAMEWAALPVVTGPNKGRSYYAGVGSNKAGITVQAIMAAVKALKQ